MVFAACKEERVVLKASPKRGWDFGHSLPPLSLTKSNKSIRQLWNLDGEIVGVCMETPAKAAAIDTLRLSRSGIQT